MTLREFLVRIGIKFDKKGAKGADAAVEKLKKAALRLVAVFGAIRVANFIRRTALEMAALGDRIDKVSEKLGVSAQALQEFRFAASLTGVEQRTLDLALQRFTRRAAEAAMGTGEAKDTLKRLGIQLKDNQGTLRPTADLLGDVADAMQKMDGDGERLAAGFKLFDSEGAGLVVTLKGGRAALDAMRQEAQALGGVLTDEDIKAGREFTDTMTKMRFAFRSIQLAIAKAVLPLFQRLTDETIGLIKASRGFIKLAVVEVFGRIVRVLGSYVQAVVQVLRMTFEWINAQSQLQKTIAAVTLGLLAFISIFFFANAPLIIMIGLLGLILDDILTFQRGGISAIGDFIEAMDELLDQWGAFGQAIRDIGSFLSNALAFWQELLFTFVNFIKNVFTAQFERAWLELTANLKTLFFERVIDPIIRSLARLASLVPSFLGGGAAISEGQLRNAFGLTTTGQVTPAPARGGTTSTQNVNMPITVNAAAGMDELAVANATRKAVREELDVQNRDALNSLTPAAGL